VAASGKAAVTGNILVWFLCAVGFLKVSQKIDSFMSSLGVNVGNTGGSMLAEALIATRGVATVAGVAGSALGGIGRRVAGGATGASGAASGFLKGGLVGAVSRKVTNDAVKTATTSTSAVHASRSKTSESAYHTASMQNDVATKTSRSATQDASIKTSQTAHSSSSRSAASSSHTATSTSHSQKRSFSLKPPSLGSTLFTSSLLAGGSFANDVIGTVARGEIRSTGSMTGDMAAQALTSYMGYTALGTAASETPQFSNVEIGGGKISGIETAPGGSEGLAFCMYHADQYTAPQGDFSRIHSADGTLWYKQYAQDAVDRKPYMDTEGAVAYQESIVKRLPDPPKRKDRI